jgi:filamentous hemagglutinin family protein
MIRRSSLNASSWVGGLLLALILGSPDRVWAQIRPDNTLGGDRSRLDTIRINGSRAIAIDGGLTRGVNLFHSFEQFNVAENQQVYFTNPGGIENIIGRVTGTDVSNIFGTLGVTGGNANLFLLNPNGIVFGENAQLDVNGSFVATSADALEFGDRGSFSALDPEPPSRMLTIDPSALLWNQLNPGDIVVRSTAANLDVPDLTGLTVDTGQSLILAGGDVIVDGGILRAPEGRIEMGGLNGTGRVEFQTDRGSNLREPLRTVELPDENRANVVLTNGALLDVTGRSRGNILIAAQDVDLSESGLCAGIGPAIACGREPVEGIGSERSRSGNIFIDANGTLTIQNRSFIGNNVSAGATGTDENVFTDFLDTLSQFIEDPNLAETDATDLLFGSIILGADVIELSGRSTVTASTLGDGSGGAVALFAREVRLIGSGDPVDVDTPETGLFSSVLPGGQGLAGGIFVVAQDFSMSDRAQMISGSFSRGDAGSVLLFANNASVTSNARISSSLLTDDARGNAGGIFIQITPLAEPESETPLIANSPSSPTPEEPVVTVPTGVLLLDGATIDSVSFGDGNAGQVSISAASMLIRQSRISSTVFDSASRGASAGGIILAANGVIRLDGSTVDSAVGSRQGGSGTAQENLEDSQLGAIVVVGSHVFLDNASQLAVNAEGLGSQGGVIFVVASDTLGLSNGSIINSSALAPASRAGLILIQAGTVSLFNQSGIGSIASETAASAGGIAIAAGSIVSLESGSVISTSAFGADNSAGAIAIQAANLVGLLGDSDIQSENGSGEEGNISIGANFLYLGELSNITTNVGCFVDGGECVDSANAPGGDGGNITFAIAGQIAFADPSTDSNIVAEAYNGGGGSIQFVGNVQLRNLTLSPSDVPIRNDISVDSRFGIDGSVTANVLDIDPIRETTELPDNLVDPADLVAATCPTPGSPQAAPLSEFYVTGRGGVPSQPSEVGSTEAVITPWVDEPPAANSGDQARDFEEASSPMSSRSDPPMVEAQSWRRDSQGQIVLTVHADRADVPSPSVTTPTCAAVLQE